MRSQSAHEQTPALREFADQLSEHSLVPLWEVHAGLVPKGPMTAQREAEKFPKIERRLICY